MGETFDDDAPPVPVCPGPVALNGHLLALLDPWPAPGSSQVVIGPGLAPVHTAD